MSIESCALFSFLLFRQVFVVVVSTVHCFGMEWFSTVYLDVLFGILYLGKPLVTKFVVFLNIVQTGVDPPPLVFEHCGANFF